MILSCLLVNKFSKTVKIKHGNHSWITQVVLAEGSCDIEKHRFCSKKT